MLRYFLDMANMKHDPIFLLTLYVSLIVSNDLEVLHMVSVNATM